MPNSDFGPKLDLILKSLSLSRGRLAAELKVDKSAVGRWVAGTMVPSDHNLAALTSFVASRRNGFTMLDWDRDLAEFTQRIGIDPTAVRRDRASLEGDSILFPSSLVEIARRETRRRGRSYEGFYEVTYASTIRTGSFVREVAVVQRRRGVLHMQMGGKGVVSSGWLFLIASQLYAVLANAPDDSFVFLVLNGIPIWHVETMDGIMVDSSGDVSLAPHATPIFFKFLEALHGSDEANDTCFAALKRQCGYIEGSALSDGLRRHLLPDVGPAAIAAGTGDLLLRMLTSRSLSRGTDSRE